MNYINNSIENFTAANGRINFRNFVNFIYFLFIKYIPMLMRSKRVSKIINNLDALHFKKNQISNSHGLTHAKSKNFTHYKKYFLKYFNDNISKNISNTRQNIFFLSDLNPDSELKNTVEAFVDSLRAEFNFLPNLVQNAYFINDISSIKAAAHSFHKDGLGVRYKVWFILKANGDIGLEFMERDFHSNDEYATYKSVYGTTELNLDDIVRQPASEGQLYCMNTECLHRGYMEDGTSRIALVFEFIDKDKMSIIEGMYSSFHSNSEINKIYNFKWLLL